MCNGTTLRSSRIIAAGTATKPNHDYNWHDASSQHSPTPVDPNNHGTFTVSEMVGDDGQGNQIGVAPGAKWIACRNMDAGGNGNPAQYTECFEFLIAPYPIGGDPSQGDPTKAPDSINNSWTCPPSEGCSTFTLQSIVDAVRAAGIFPAMAASNYGPDCSTIQEPPAIYASSVDVGALDSANNIAGFSSRGPVTADGSNRTKPRCFRPWSKYSRRGSREAAIAPVGPERRWLPLTLPGGVALIWQAKPSLVGDIDGTQTLYRQTAQHLTDSQAAGFCRGPSFLQDNTFGYGLLNLLRAVQ